MRLHSADNLTSAISACMLSQSKVSALTFLAPGMEPKTITYGQLHSDAKTAAIRFVDAGILPGDVVVLATGHDLELIVAYLGLLYAGAIPTIAPYASAFSQKDRYKQRIIEIARSCQARSVVTLPNTQVTSDQITDNSDCIILNICTITASPSLQQMQGLPIHVPKPEDPAYIQFSSGTTGTPKGAVVYQKAAVEHLALLTNLLELRENDVLVGWAPYYHDLGLVLYLLLPMVSGVPVVTMAPQYWVRRPHVLLKAVQEYRGTVSFMPAFGFAHVLRYTRQKDTEGLDLSCLRLLVAGAEVIQPDILRRFTHRFTDIGLRPNVVQVGYGMTECVFMGCLTSLERPPRIDAIDRRVLIEDHYAQPDSGSDAMEVVSCGEAPPGCSVTICDEMGSPVADRLVGEIVINSPTLFQYYLNQQDLTRRVLKEGRLHTGDLGYCTGKELFVVDRKKDIIISAGKHIYPELLEQVALVVIGDAGGRAAAFGIQSPEVGTEIPVIVCEYRGNIAQTELRIFEESIGQRVYRETNILLADVRMVRRGWLEITTSGKVGRSSSRRKYIRSAFGPQNHNVLSSVCLSEDPIEIEMQIFSLAKEILRLSVLSPDENLVEQGADSINLVRLVLEVEKNFGVALSIDLFSEPTVKKLVSAVLAAREAENNFLEPSRANAFEDLPKEKPRHTKAVSVAKVHGIRHWRLRCKEELHRMILRGPLAAKDLLPYSLGCLIHRGIVRQPALHHHFASELKFLRKWHAEIGRSSSDINEAIRISLLANTWVQWRTHSIPQKDTHGKWYQIKDPECWLIGKKPFRGTVIALPHVGRRLITPLRLMCREAGREITLVGNTGLPKSNRSIASLQVESRAKSLWLAQQVLRRNGVAFIAADGLQGKQAVSIPFWGRDRPFQVGAAELAVSTGALLVPAYITFDAQGRVYVHITRPLPVEGKTFHAKVMALTESYGEDYAKRWPELYSSMSWRHLAYNWRLPRK